MQVALALRAARVYRAALVGNYDAELASSVFVLLKASLTRLHEMGSKGSFPESEFFPNLCREHRVTRTPRKYWCVPLPIASTMFLA